MAKKSQPRCAHCGWTLNSLGYCPQCEDSHEYEAWEKAQKEKETPTIEPAPTTDNRSKAE